jgi:hypothetical protein
VSAEATAAREAAERTALRVEIIFGCYCCCCGAVMTSGEIGSKMPIARIERRDGSLLLFVK